MSDSTRFSVGIDPGYGCAGLVLVRHDLVCDTVVAFSLFEDLLGRGAPTVFRSQDMARRLGSTIGGWVAAHGIRDLAVGLELPIYNRNPEAYAKQYTLIQAIEAVLCSYVAPRVDDLVIAEPNPSESKHLATGSGAASKDEMYRKSPFVAVEFRDAMAKLTKDQRETLSDAWAHSLAARKGCERRFDAKQMKWPMPRKEK